MNAFQNKRGFEPEGKAVKKENGFRGRRTPSRSKDRGRRRRPKEPKKKKDRRGSRSGSHGSKGKKKKSDKPMRSAAAAALEKIRAGEKRNVEHVALVDDASLAVIAKHTVAKKKKKKNLKRKKPLRRSRRRRARQ